MSRPERPAPPPDFDENPEWTDEMFARARRGAPWMWAGDDAAQALREAAKGLRAEADRLDAQAERIETAGTQ